MKIVAIFFSIFAAVNCSIVCDLMNKDVSLTKITIYNKNFPLGTPLVAGTIIQGSDIFVLAHEWLFDSKVKWILTTTPNLLRLYPNANVVVIDYSPYSNNPVYIPDVCTSPYVGELVADVLISLNVDPSVISCTGHSMGAQVCGALGRRFIEKGLGQIARLTAIDAAGPGYDTRNYIILVPVAKHISQDDAKQVVGIYTDSNGWGFGMHQNSGYSHINIIINKGYNQPSCEALILCPVITILSLLNANLLECVFCSHRFSNQIYERALGGQIYKLTKCLNYNDFKAGKCNGNPTFNYSEKLDPSITDGSYFINVNSA